MSNTENVQSEPTFSISPPVTVESVTSVFSMLDMDACEMDTLRLEIVTEDGDSKTTSEFDYSGPMVGEMVKQMLKRMSFEDRQIVELRLWVS